MFQGTCTWVDFPRGPLVAILPPEAEVVDTAALRQAFPRLTIVRQRVTEVIGPCAVQGCTGTVRQISIPVLVDPTADLATGEKTLHHRRGCSACDCPVAR